PRARRPTTTMKVQAPTPTPTAPRTGRSSVRRTRRLTVFVLGAVVAAGCQPVTTRPAFVPFPEAASTEIRIGADDAVRRLAEALRADSIPVAKFERRDG